jgi:hypothetical protein
MRMNLFNDLGYLRQLPEDSKEAIAAEKAGHRVKLNTKTGREAARKIFAESIGQRERVVVTPTETLKRRIERMSAAIADMKTQLDGLEALPEGDEPAETGKK